LVLIFESRYKVPIITETAATIMGYCNPASASAVYMVVNKVAIKGVRPPNTPLPI
jgi:hypothetical protein